MPVSPVIKSLEVSLLNLKCWKLRIITLNIIFPLIKRGNGSFLVCHRLTFVAYNPNILCSDRTETNSPAHSSVLTHFESQRTCFCFLNSPRRLQTLLGINNNKHSARFEEGPSPCHKQPYIPLYISDILDYIFNIYQSTKYNHYAMTGTSGCFCLKYEASAEGPRVTTLTSTPSR